MPSPGPDEGLGGRLTEIVFWLRWFQVSFFLIFTPILGKIPILTNILQKGLKPPTRFVFVCLVCFFSRFFCRFSLDTYVPVYLDCIDVDSKTGALAFGFGIQFKGLMPMANMPQNLNPMFNEPFISFNLAPNCSSDLSLVNRNSTVTSPQKGGMLRCHPTLQIGPNCGIGIIRSGLFLWNLYMWLLKC